jgi:hypothetical protein
MTPDPKEALERLTVEDVECLRWIASHQPKDARDLIDRFIAEREGLEREAERWKIEATSLHSQLQSTGRRLEHAGAAHEAAESALFALVAALKNIAALEPVTDETTGRIDDAAQETARQALSAISVAPPSQGMETRYAALGRACESNGLGWYAEDGTMRFQPPADVIEEQALAKAQYHPDVSGLVEAVTMAAERLSTQGQSTPLGPTEAIYFGKMRGIAADLFSALAALQSHKGGEGDSELAAADNNREALVEAAEAASDAMRMAGLAMEAPLGRVTKKHIIHGTSLFHSESERLRQALVAFQGMRSVKRGPGRLDDHCRCAQTRQAEIEALSAKLALAETGLETARFERDTLRAELRVVADQIEGCAEALEARFPEPRYGQETAQALYAWARHARSRLPGLETPPEDGSQSGGEPREDAQRRAATNSPTITIHPGGKP